MGDPFPMRIAVSPGHSAARKIRHKHLPPQSDIHCEAGFDIRIAFKEDLREVPDWEFGIYDDEIALRLSLDKDNQGYGVGTIYSDRIMVQAYQERFDIIKAKSYKADKNFWNRYLNSYQ